MSGPPRLELEHRRRLQRRRILRRRARRLAIVGTLLVFLGLWLVLAVLARSH